MNDIVLVSSQAFERTIQSLESHMTQWISDWCTTALEAEITFDLSSTTKKNSLSWYQDKQKPSLYWAVDSSVWPWKTILFHGVEQDCPNDGICDEIIKRAEKDLTGGLFDLLGYKGITPKKIDNFDLDAPSLNQDDTRPVQINICIAGHTLKLVLSRSFFSRETSLAKTKKLKPIDLKSIASTTQVNVTLTLGRYSLLDISSLEKGHVLTSDQPIEEGLDICVNNQVFARSLITKDHEKKAVIILGR